MSSSSLILSNTKVNSEKLEKALDVTLVKLNDMVERTKRGNPSKLRANYDSYWNSLIEKEADAEKIKSELNDSIVYINNCINKTDDVINVINQFRTELNNKKVGTLEGLSRQTIKKGDIPDDISYETEQVLNQNYDEMGKSSASGGVRKKTKSKKGKKGKRKTIKKR